MAWWLESHQELRDHPKTKALCRALGEPRAHVVGYLHCLWWWALDYAQDGDLTRYSAEVIAEAAEMPGDAARCVDALATAGFLDRTSSGYRLHDWDDYAGRLVARRSARAEKMRERRAGHVTSRNSHVTVTCQSRDNQQNQTEQNQTETGRGTGEPSGDPSADAEGTPSASPGADAPPPPAAEEEPVRESAPETPAPEDPLAEPLRRLRSLPGYRARADDLPWLSSLAADFSRVDLVRAIPHCRDYWEPRDSRPGAKRANWRARLHNWCERACRFSADRNGTAPPAEAMRYLDDDPQFVAEARQVAAMHDEVRQRRAAAAPRGP